MGVTSATEDGYLSFTEVSLVKDRSAMRHQTRHHRETLLLPRLILRRERMSLRRQILV